MGQRSTFVCKSGEGGNAAENADEHEQAKLLIEDTPLLGNTTKKSDRQAADQIDRQRPHRKPGLVQNPEDPTRDQIAPHRTNKTARADQENCFHVFQTPLFKPM